MSQPTSKRELLFGMVAISQQFLKPDELVDATITWSQGDKKHSLAESLVEQGALTSDEQAIVDSLVRDKSEDDLCDTLQSALGADVFGAVRQALERIDDAAISSTAVVKSTSRKNACQSIGDEQRFEISKELARGGLGAVFVARDKQLNRDVALKQILERWVDHPDFNERFLMEAEITGRLEHPSVVPVYALGQREDGVYYYAMRLIGGVTLEEEIRQFFNSAQTADATQRNLDQRQLLRRFIDVCNTIDYAHSRGIIHRDLKPANIMLGKYGETLVVDWGLAKQVDIGERPIVAAESLLVPGSGSGSAPTQYGSALGTPQYMSPEQAAGKLDRLGPASDVYALGATFYHLLTGQPPQAGAPLDQLLKRVERSEFPAPRTVCADVAKPLEAICLQAMQLNPSDRYRSAGDMARDIERWLADQRVEAYDEPIVAQAARSIRRHQTAAATGAVTLILLYVAAVVGSLLWQRAQTLQQQQAQALLREQLEREQEEQRRLAERRSNAEANLRFGRIEAEAGRFQNALVFFEQGQEACANESSLEELESQLSKHGRQMTRLVEFEQLSDEGILAYSFELDQRAIVLLTESLQRLGVFDHSDWWRHLPVENVNPREADRIEKRIHLELVLLCGVIAKNSLSPQLLLQRRFGLPPPALSEEQQRLRNVFRRVALCAQSYRTTEWITRLEESRQHLDGEIHKLPPPPVWKAETFIDNFQLGSMALVLSFSNGGAASEFAAEFLGPEDQRETGVAYLRKACDLQPENYLANVMLGWMQQRVGDYEGAYQRLTYAISLRPDLMLAYSLRSAFRFEEALSLPADAEERQRLIMLSMQDANTSRKLGDQYEINHWLRGMALRELQQTPLAVAAYLDALEREPPLTMLKLSKMSTIFSQQDPNQVRRLSFLMNDRYQQANAFGQQLGENDSDNADYALLEAVAALELVDSSRRDDLFPARRAEFTAALQEAETATQRLLKIIANTSSLDPKVESMAQGCVARSGNIAVNCPRRGTRSLKRCVWTARTHGRLLDWPPRWRSWLRKARILCKPGWPWLPMKSSPTSRLPIGNSCSPTRVAFGCC